MRRSKCLYLIKITMIISVTVSTCVPALLTTGVRINYHSFISNNLPTFVGDIHIDCNHDMTEKKRKNKRPLLYRTPNMRLIWLIVAKNSKRKKSSS